jgi:hypothetical protein
MVSMFSYSNCVTKRPSFYPHTNITPHHISKVFSRKANTKALLLLN